MIQHRKFEGSTGYVLHKVTGPFSGRCSAWYEADGTLKDAEQCVSLNGRTRQVKKGGPMWQYLQTVGLRYVNARPEVFGR